MVLPLIGAALGAGANLLGGFLGRESQEEQRAKNEALQREFAQSSIQWRVADAKKAGVHPLYALGAPSMSPAVSVLNDPVASSLGSMGQDLTRASLATASQPERNTVFDKTMQELSLQRATLQNDYLVAQIARLRGQIGPGLPTDMPVEEETVMKLPHGKTEGVTPIVIGGTKIAQDPGMSNANEFEDRYGETMSDWVFGPYIAWRDFNSHVLEPASRRFEERRRRWHGEKSGDR